MGSVVPSQPGVKMGQAEPRGKAPCGFQSPPPFFPVAVAIPWGLLDQLPWTRVLGIQGTPPSHSLLWGQSSSVPPIGCH